MRFQYLGTAASEGWPAVFCNCPQCRDAARRGGRDIRTRSQTLIDGHILIDLPADTYLHKLQHGLDLSAVDLLLITHSHADHLYPAELGNRGGVYAHDMTSPALQVFCGQGSLDKIRAQVGLKLEQDIFRNITFTVLRAYEPAEACGCRVVALPADHAQDEDAFTYSIQTGGKNILYLHDTGECIDEVYEYLRVCGVAYDFVSLDCTYGIRDNVHLRGHMGLPNNLRMRDRLLDTGCCGAGTVFCVNHFSHNIPMTYEDMDKAARAAGMLSSYDGMVIDI